MIAQITYGNLLTDLAGTNLAVESSDSLTLASTITGLTSVSSTAFTGSLQGTATTASYVLQAVSSSFATSASFSQRAYSASVATTASYATIVEFPTNQISNATSTTTFFVNTDISQNPASNRNIGWGDLLTDIAGTNLTSDGDSINLNTTITGLTSVSSTAFSGSFSGSFQGDGSNLTGIASVLSVSGSDGSNGTVNLKTQALTITGTSNEIETSVSGQTVTVGLPNDVTVTGDLTVSGNDIKMSGGTTALTFSGAGDVTVAGDLKVSGNDIKASDGSTAITLNGANVTIAGDLNVNGTTTTIDTTNLLVEDKFALFASGSDGNTDGGIVIQQGASTGYALGVDASADRWALQNNTSPTATSITPDAFMGVIQEGSADPASNPVYGGASGFGTIFVDSNTGNIWIYS
jgi:hypothetical protein